jgi:hypothetical protein
MKNRLLKTFWIILWISPVFIILATIIYGKVVFSGLSVPWRLIGKPSENITKIIGVKFSENKLYVATSSGGINSLFIAGYLAGVSLPVHWINEGDPNILIDPVSNYGGERFTPPPPPFKPIQIFEFGIPATESTQDYRFALSADGNLWYWHHVSSAYQGLFFVMLLGLEILMYLLALLIYVVIVLITYFVHRHRRARALSRAAQIK